MCSAVGFSLLPYGRRAAGGVTVMVIRMRLYRSAVDVY